MRQRKREREKEKAASAFVLSPVQKYLLNSIAEKTAMCRPLQKKKKKTNFKYQGIDKYE